MPRLTLEHVSQFVPCQLFEMVAPNDEEYLLELTFETFEEIEEAVEISRQDPSLAVYPIKNLSVYSEQIPLYSFYGLQELLSAIKRYLPCWTNKW